MQQSIQEPTKDLDQRGEEEEEGAPSYELLIQGHAQGEKEKEKEEKKRRRRGEDEKTNDAPSYAPRIQGRAKKEGRGCSRGA